MTKFICAYILENDTDVFKLSYESVYDTADKIIVVWSKQEIEQQGNPKYNFLDQYGIVDPKNKLHIIEKQYSHSYKGANGKQRNVYLDYLKKNHVDDWCLVIDADEVLELSMEKQEFMEKCDKFKCKIFGPQMRHIMYHLDKEDTERPIHYCHGRLFKIDDSLFYEEVEHPILGSTDKANDTRGELRSAICLWHFAYARELFRTKAKFLNHKKKSNVHGPGYLHWWYLSHLFGNYPHSKYDLKELPQNIKDFFLISDIDELLYFQNRQSLEAKHFLECREWMDFFKHKSVIYCGCGMGQRVFVADYNGLVVQGFDISKYAINNTPYDNIKNYLSVGNILVQPEKHDTYDLVVAYDILEHLEYKDLDLALQHIKNATNKNVLISVPVLGDSNLEKDNTHIIKESKDWWLEKIKKYFKIIPTPEHWQYHEQIIIGELK